eukprot:COSAG04_NODE_3749_length_2560_cov_2.186103_1_plen_102_part_00
MIELLDRERLAELWEGQCGLDGGAGPLIFYCGSGWRSALAWFLAVAVLGWEVQEKNFLYRKFKTFVPQKFFPVQDCRNYDGGWLEYSQTSPGADKHPVEQG